ncbi:MAG TPA: sulfotransferase [Gemmatimonadales bacterium]|nr:sulfotransferase [Gemmatimonadales bacterium]
MNASKPTYAYIAGSGRSGSTLLDAALGSHPNILSVGEIGRLPDSLLDEAKFSMPDRCACEASFDACPLWGPILNDARQLNLSSITPDGWYEFLLPRLRAFKPEARVIVDSTNWIRPLTRLLESQVREEYEVKVIYLTRDARGVVNSASNRGFHRGLPTEWYLPVWRAAAGWWARNRLVLRMYRRLDPAARLHVTYERFTADPDGVLRGIQRFLGVPESALMPDWKQIPRHTFAGNWTFREDGSSEIREDTKWRYELGPGSTALVELLAGRLNRKLMRGL